MDPDVPPQAKKKRKPKHHDRFGRFLNNDDSVDTPGAGPSTPRAEPSAPTNVVRAGFEGNLQPKPGRTHHLEKQLHNYTGGDPERLAELLDNIQSAVKTVIERGSPLTRQHYKSAKLSFEVSVRILANGENIPDPWTRDAVSRFAEEYLEFRAEITRGRQGEKIKAITLCGWYSHLVVVIAQNAHDPITGKKCGGIMLYREGLCKQLEDRTYTIISQKKLNRFSRSRARRTFGPAEIQMVIEHLVVSSVDRGRLVRIQEWCALIMAMMSAVRPGSLCASHVEYKKSINYLQVKDFRIYTRGPVTWDVEVDIRNIKGYNQVALGRVLNYWFRAVRLIKNLLFDPWVIVAYLWARGCLPQYKTLDALIATKDDELVLSNGEEPFFLSSAPGGTRLIPGEPLTSARLGENIGAACKSCGFPNIVLYDARKDAANDLEKKLGSHAASLGLGHKEAATVATEFYSLGVGNIDVVGIRTGEASDQFVPGYKSRLDMRMRTGTAVSYVSKAIALAGQRSADDDEDANEGERVKRALEQAQQTRDELVNAAVEKALQESQKVREYQASVEQCWEAWVATFELGSDLYMLYKSKSVSKVQSNVSEIKKWNLYLKAAEEEEFKIRAEAAEAALRDAFGVLAAEKKELTRNTRRIVRRRLDREQLETHNDTYEDKNLAVDYVKQQSSLITHAEQTAQSSTVPLEAHSASEELALDVESEELPSTEHLKALGAEEDDLIAEDAIDEYNEVLNFMPKNFTGGSGSKIQEILDSAQKDIEDQADEELPEKQPEQHWDDDDSKEEYQDALIVDTKIALMKGVMDPYLFELECKERSDKGNGVLTCYKCPDDSIHTYTKFAKLKSHLKQQHTEWIGLSSKMEHGNMFVCPGICGISKQFGSEAEVREHCLSDDCRDKNAFLSLKARHDQAQIERYNAQNKYKADIPARDRLKAYQSRLQYFGSLDANDLLELADLHGILREEITPYIPAMLKNFKFVAEMLLNTGGQDRNE